MDQSMAMSNMKLDRVVSTVENLARSVDKFINGQVQIGMQRDMSISGLARLQADAQARIAQQQIALPYAQAMHPSMFPGAPSTAYQISPGQAIFRNQIGSSTPLIAQSPMPSFAGDILRTNPFLRTFYEPSFAEDPFLSTYSARQRIDERLETVARGGSDLAVQIGAGALAWKGVSAGARSFASRIGLGFIPGVGTAAAIADTALGIFGLPSISGAVGAVAGGAWDITGGQFFANRDMTRDITKSTRFFTGAGSAITGQGLGVAGAGAVVRGLRGMSSRQKIISVSSQRPVIKVFLTCLGMKTRCYLRFVLYLKILELL
jgi:hypothetical protein